MAVGGCLRSPTAQGLPGMGLVFGLFAFATGGATLADQPGHGFRFGATGAAEHSRIFVGAIAK